MLIRVNNGLILMIREYRPTPHPDPHTLMALKAVLGAGFYYVVAVVGQDEMCDLSMSI